MFRAILAGLAVLALGGAVQSAAAETVSDTEHNFRVTVPTGWASLANPTENIRIVLGSPRREQTGGSCNVVTEPHPPSKTLSPAQIETELDKELNEASWLAMFKTVIFVDNIVIEKTGSESMNGRKVYYVLATFNTVMPGAAVRQVRLKQYLHAIPGEIFFVTCSATQGSYAQEEDDFKTVFNSFAPLNNAVASAQPSGAASLTLYAGADFAGVSRVVTRDTPDLTAFGWHDAAASMSTSGAAVWQVCEAANYAGRCRVVADALHERLAVASARRLSPAQISFATMMQAGGATGVSRAAGGR